MDIVKELTEINLDELVLYLGVKDKPFISSLTRWIFRATVEKYSRQLIEFDNDIFNCGLNSASEKLLKKFAKDIKIFGHENIPLKGQAIFLSNHPGMVDSLALFSAIKRTDLRIIAYERPLLKYLKNMSSRLIYVNNNPLKNLSSLKVAIEHLKSGGALLTFPAGNIEQDPDIHQLSNDNFKAWSRSPGFLAVSVPEAMIVPILVSGVLWKEVFFHPIIKIRKSGKDRENLGAALQLLVQVFLDKKPLKVSIKFAKTFTAGNLNTKDPLAIHNYIINSMEGLINSC